MQKTAILMDGAFYRKRAYNLFGDKTPEERAKELSSYCHRHIKEEKKGSYIEFFTMIVCLQKSRYVIR